MRQGWRGERDSRGDTAWVPPEMIERIEVLRGPAAARYGNGAAGGVVNIITKKAGDALHGSLNGYFNVPQHKQEGATKRTDFSLSGPLSDSLSFRLFGGYSKTQADAWDINESHKSERVGAYANSLPAGREGWSIKHRRPAALGLRPSAVAGIRVRLRPPGQPVRRRYPKHQHQCPGAE